MSGWRTSPSSSSRRASPRLLLSYGPEKTGRETMRSSLSQTELAEMVGATRENVNHCCLRDWHRRGLVRLQDGWDRHSSTARSSAVS